MKKFTCKTKVPFTFLLLFLSLFLGCATTPIKETRTIGQPQKPPVEIVEAEGIGPIIDGDIIKARNTAIADAQKRAIELVVGVYISAENWVSKAKLIEDNITGETEGYIEKCEILKEVQENNFYKVRIKAHVRKEDLSEKIQALDLTPKEQRTAKISLWIKEKVDDKPTDTATVEKELAKILIENGFTISDRKPKEYFATIKNVLESDPDNLENKLQSDIVILGEASSSFNTDQGLGGFTSYRAFASLKVIKNSNKEIIATAQDSAAGIDLHRNIAANNALSNVAKKIGKDLPNKIIQYFKEHPYSLIIVKGASNINEIHDLTRSIRALPKVKDCWLKSFASEEALLEFIIKRGTIGEIAKQIEQILPYTVENVDVNDVNSVTLQKRVAK
ncbi:MAG: hypothetical protein QME68_00090 [Elusimicrobiota bacterium]|nr:hypothetical protein [Elusimicrobiota bacterium]